MRTISIGIAIACATAHAADPQLGRIGPQGGQRGTELTVEFFGSRIGLDPQEVMLLNMTADDSGLKFSGIEKVDDNRAKATLSIPADCPLGRHALRFRTASGVSNLATFHVGALPEINEVEPNSSTETPQPITSGCTINGVVEREDVDYFAIDLAGGERLAVEVEGLRLGRTFFDPMLRIVDSKGFELAASDDETITFQDAFCVVVAPQAGRYTIELRESAYRGDGNCGYRLHVGKFPRPAAVYPPGGRVGEKIAFTWLGDGRPAWQQEVQLPAEANDKFDVYAQDTAGTAPSPNFLRVTQLPVAREVEPNDGRDNATSGESPGVFVGIIDKAGDHDFFRFAAKKGDRLNVTSYARHLRSPLDAVVRVLNASGGRLAGNDDNQGNPDSLSQFTVPEDGDYLVEIEDHLDRGGENYVYWIEVAPEPARVELALAEQRQYVATTIDVPAGNRTTALLEVRRKGVGGDLKIEWSNLPAGVTAECPIVPASESRIPVVFHAAGDATPGGSYATLLATGTEGSEPMTTTFDQMSMLVRGQNNRDVWSHHADRATVTATKAIPFKLTLVAPKAPLVQRGVKYLKVIAERDEGFTDSILVKMLYNPAGISSNASLRIKQKENEVLIPLTADQSAAVRTWPIVMVGEADVGGRVVAATELTDLTVSEPYLQMTLPKVNVEQGNSVEFAIDVEQLKPFEGNATVKLEGLSPGVSTEPAEIDSQTTKLVFQLQVAKDARPGQQKRLFCRVVLTEAGEPVEHMMGDGELRVDEPISERISEPLNQPTPEATAQARN